MSPQTLELMILKVKNVNPSMDTSKAKKKSVHDAQLGVSPVNLSRFVLLVSQIITYREPVYVFRSVSLVCI